MTCIMARESAYSGHEITWEMIMNSQLDRQPKNFGYKEAMPLPPRFRCRACISSFSLVPSMLLLSFMALRLPESQPDSSEKPARSPKSAGSRDRRRDG